MKPEVREKVMFGVKNALDRAKRLWLNKMITDCPVDLGRLRQSLMIVEEKPDGGFTIKAAVDYASFVEKGTGRMVKAHGVHDPRHPVEMWEAKRKRDDVGPSTMPFMVPAIYSTKAKFAEILVEEIRGAFK